MDAPIRPRVAARTEYVREQLAVLATIGERLCALVGDEDTWLARDLLYLGRHLNDRVQRLRAEHPCLRDVVDHSRNVQPAKGHGECARR